MPQLQVALDFLDMETAVHLTRSLQPYVDIVEVGTTMIVDHGLEAVRRIRSAATETEVLADLKVIDAGYEEADAAFRSGADIVTVLALASDLTIKQVIRAAQEGDRGRVMADLIETPQPETRARQVIDLGVDSVCVHTSVDRQAAGEGNPHDEFVRVRESCPDASVAISGGVNLESAPALAAAGPSIVIVGGAITKAADPVGVAQALSRILREDS